jgi:ornithine cyclodeaminase/alanine dehydrogenase-like protein (mu-crystallin family)
VARYRRVLGDDHPDTLTAAYNVAVDLRALGEYQQARALDEDTVARYRRVLGDDHPHTLASADNLAVDLRALGEHEQARQLQEWIRSQRGRRITHRDRAG